MDFNSGRWELAYPMGFVDYHFGGNGIKSFKFNPQRTKQQIDDLASLGLRWAMTGGINPLDGPESDIEEIVRIGSQWLRDAGLKVTSWHMAGPSFHRLERSQETVVANMLRNVRLFAPFKPKAMVMHAGWIWDTPEDIQQLPDSMFKHGECDRVLHMYAQEVARHGEDAVIATLAANMKVMAREAARYDMCLAFENMGDMMPVGSFDTLGKLVAAVDEPNAGYCLDSGHAWMRGENPVDWVHFMGKKLFETHFHDNRGGSKAVEPLHGDDEHLPPGFGTIDWRKVIQAMDEIGFPGPVTFESEGWQLPDRLEGFRHAMRYWRGCERMALTK